MRSYNFNGFKTDECVNLGLDVNDLVILSYLMVIQGGYGLETINIDEKPYTWLTYDKIAEDNPILYMRARTVGLRMAHLKSLGLVEIIVKCKENTKFKKSYFRVSELGRDLMFSGLKENDIKITREKEKVEKTLDLVEEENSEIVEQWENDFQRFYKAYPKKQDKQNVIKWFKKNKPNQRLMDQIMAALEKFKKTKQWQENKGQFIPMPSTWLNNKRWEDEIVAKKMFDEEIESNNNDLFNAGKF